MKRGFLILIFLLPVFLMAQVTTTGSDEQQDSVEQTHKAPKAKKQVANQNADQVPDYKKNGLFQAIFHAGINAAQVDGDDFSGYNRLGFDGGVGAMIRFHKYLSVSMCLDYSMKGAKASLKADKNPSDSGHYQLKLNYIEIPLMLNIHDKNIIMFSIGPQIDFLVGYKETNLGGADITNSVSNGFPFYGPPHKVQLEGVAALHFIIKQHFAFGGKFSYSILKMRGPVPGNRYPGEYNNVLTFDLQYIMSTVKKK